MWLDAMLMGTGYDFMVLWSWWKVWLYDLVMIAAIRQALLLMELV